MSKHTPGPWTVRPNQFDDWGIVSNNAGYVVACARAGRVILEDEYADHRRKGTDPYEANARLIAAAPDLLAACKSALELFGTLPNQRYSDHLIVECAGVIESAIAKAGGE